MVFLPCKRYLTKKGLMGCQSQRRSPVQRNTPSIWIELSHRRKHILPAAALFRFLRELQRFAIASLPATSAACYLAIRC